MSNRQQDFETALHGVITQGQPGINERGFCTYLHEGVMCGIGHVLKLEGKDLESYGSWIDEGLTDLFLIEDEKFDLLPQHFYEDREFYSDMQDAHDEAWLLAKAAPTNERNETFIRLFRQSMAQFAQRYQLEVPA